eukprot:TRINITY_DN4595_c0_g1_i1.p1 TRINITY_DN4595_c0_g1~~TRINITY_DN4595_c0_g1_i1.p1  ORF type:complete len:119 (-),score=23.93 TRINITY_DN4595_c0_g1_i1:11-367(-)
MNLSFNASDYAFVNEINIGKFGEGKSVRVIGMITSIDIPKSTAEIDYKGNKLNLDTKLLEKIDFKLNQLVQIIGEIYYIDNKAFLRARISRLMTGFDINYYEKIVKIKRDWEFIYGNI